MSITYEKIKSEIEKRNYRLKYFIREFAEMGEKGFKLSCENETLKVRTLQLISKALKVPMAYWFQEEDQWIIEETTLTYGDSPSIIIKELRNQLNESNDDKRRYKKQIDELSEKLGLSKEAV